MAFHLHAQLGKVSQQSWTKDVHTHCFCVGITNYSSFLNVTHLGYQMVQMFG